MIISTGKGLMSKAAILWCVASEDEVKTKISFIHKKKIDLLCKKKKGEFLLTHQNSILCSKHSLPQDYGG